MPAKWPPPTMQRKMWGLVIVWGKGTPLEASVGGFDGTGLNCFERRTSTRFESCSCSVAVKRALYTPREVFDGRRGVENHSNGGLPDPRFFFFGENMSTSSGSVCPILTCFLRSVVKVVSFGSSSSSDSVESEPDRLSLRSSTSFSNSVSVTAGLPLSFCFRLYPCQSDLTCRRCSRRSGNFALHSTQLVGVDFSSLDPSLFGSSGAAFS